MNKAISHQTLPYKKTTNAFLAALLCSFMCLPAHAADELSADQMQPAELQLPNAEAATSAPQADQSGSVLPKDASMKDVQDKLEKMSEKGNEKLEKLLEESVGTTDFNKSVDSNSKDNTDLTKLKTNVEKAELINKLYKLMNADEDQLKKELDTVKAERDKLIADKTAMEAQLEALSKQVASQSKTETQDTPNPVIVLISGAEGKLEARLLVANAGEVIARPGDVLPDGTRIKSIRYNGVVAQRNGRSFNLAFGQSLTTVSKN